MSDVIVVLPAPVCADEGDRLAGFDVQVDVVEHGDIGHVVEGDVVEVDAPLDVVELDGVWLVLDAVGSVSSTSKMRVPPAMARWSMVYCSTRSRMGSKKRVT